MRFRLITFALSTFVVGCAAPGQPNVAATAPTPTRPAPSARPQILLLECDTLPNYPSASLRKLETGTVRLTIEVDASGKVTASRVKTSSGFAELDNAALSTLSRCPFMPAYKDGQPIAGATDISYDWRIK